MQAAGVDGANDYFTYCGWQDVLGANLDHTRLTGLSVGQEGTEIKIVRENDQSVLTGVLHNLGIGSGRLADMLSKP